MGISAKKLTNDQKILTFSFGVYRNWSIFAPAIRNDGGIAQPVRAHDS